MLAVAASAKVVAPLLSGGLTVANINSPNQVVLAGPVSEIEKAETCSAGKVLPCAVFRFRPHSTRRLWPRQLRLLSSF